MKDHKHYFINFIVLMFLPFNSSCFADTTFAFKAIANVNGGLLASPPLPDLRGKKGKTSITLRPAFFESSGTEGDGSGANSFSGTIDFSGYGGAALYHSQFSENFGWYVMSMYNSMSGEFSSSGNGNGGAFEITIPEASSTFTLVGGGLSLRLFPSSFFSVQVFGGPAIIKTTTEQTVNSNSGDDFDQTIDATVNSYFVGAQAGILLTKYIELNPYFIMTAPLSDEDTCLEYESEVRGTGTFFDFTDPECLDQHGNNTGTPKTKFDMGLDAFGMNVKFPTIGLAVNVLADLGDLQGFQGAEVQLYYVSYTMEL